MEADDSKNTQDWLKFSSSLLVSGVFIYLTFRGIEVARVFDELGHINLFILSLSLLTKLAGFVLMTFRSKLLLRDEPGFAFGYVFRSILLAFVGNNLLPFRAGEVLRVGYLTRKEKSKAASCTATVALERFLDVFVLAFLFTGLLAFSLVDWSQSGVLNKWYVLSALLLIGVGMSAIAWSSRYPSKVVDFAVRLTKPFGDRAAEVVEQLARDFMAGLHGVNSYSRGLSAAAITLGYWLTSVGSVAIWMWAFGFSVPLYAPAVVALFTAFATVIPSSPGFVGTYHYFVTVSLGIVGIEGAKAVSFALVGHAVSTIPFTVVGVIWLSGDLINKSDEQVRGKTE